MAFSSFTLPLAQEQFGLTLETSQPLFPNVCLVEAGAELHRNLDTLGQLALRMNTEKARSEWLIAPVLGEMWVRAQRTVCLLSGVDFSFDKDVGLSGVVDFLIGKGPQVSWMTAPVLAVVEGKNESIPNGQGQCAAEMVASLRFNQKAKTSIDTVYGVVTTGNNWLFHRLHGNELAIDTREYLISEVDQILGILMHIVGLNPTHENAALPQQPQRVA
jgi:co-chaperonin GroES (HSP10)